MFPPRTSALVTAVLVALSAMAAIACERRAGAPALAVAVTVALPTAVPLAQEPACAPLALDEAEAPTRPRPPERAVSLAALLPATSSEGRPSTKRAPRRHANLGRREWTWSGPHRAAELEVSRLSLPAEVPRADMPADLLAPWDRERATQRELRHAFIQHARVEQARTECGRAHCRERACLEEAMAQVDVEIHAIKDRRATERAELVDAFRRSARTPATPALQGTQAPQAGVLLALASVLDDQARANEAIEDLDADPRVGEAVELYGRARGVAAPEIAWFAGYGRANLLADTPSGPRKAGLPSHAELAKAEYLVLAGMPAPAERIAEALYRAASLEDDSAKAMAIYRRAAFAAPTGNMLRAVSALRWAQTALDVDRARETMDAIEAGAMACEETSRSGEGLDVAWAAEPLATALGRVLAPGAELALPSLPASAFAAVADLIAREAVERLDFGHAEIAWSAIRTETPDAREAAAALAGLAALYERTGRDDLAKAIRVRPGLPPPPSMPPRAASVADEDRELTGRVLRLARECLNTHGDGGVGALELTITTRTAATGAVKVSARDPKKAEPSQLMACFVEHGPAHFVDAPADMEFTLVVKRPP
jgi:hypothetical protein